MIQIIIRWREWKMIWMVICMADMNILDGRDEFKWLYETCNESLKEIWGQWEVILTRMFMFKWNWKGFTLVYIYILEATKPNVIHERFIALNIFNIEIFEVREGATIYGAWMISRHIFNLRTGQKGFSKINPS